MMRERLVAERMGRRPFAEREIRRVFAALLTGVAAPLAE
jgi:threonine/homoserine/homoserine lactone efflux protein